MKQRQLTEAIDTSVFPEKAHPFVLFNTSGYQKTEVVTVEVEIERLPFYTGKPEDLYHELKQKAPDYQVIDQLEKPLQAVLSKMFVLVTIYLKMLSVNRTWPNT